MSSSLQSIDFYQLLGGQLDELASQLVEKCRAAGKRVVIYNAPSSSQSQSEQLWTIRDLSFLAHGIDTDEGQEFAPIWISSDVSQNQIKAEFAILKDGMVPSDLEQFERILVIFDGRDEQALLVARAQWKDFSSSYQDKCRYFAKTEEGRWQQKQ